MLRSDQVLADGKTVHQHERDAIEWIKQNLPASEPIRLWALVDLVEPSGRRYEVDAIVLGPNALYLVEIKSWEGRIVGDGENGRTSLRDNPHSPPPTRPIRVVPST